MLFLIVVCRMYDMHELKMVGRIMRGIRVEKKIDGIFRGKRVENKNRGNFNNINVVLIGCKLHIS